MTRSLTKPQLAALRRASSSPIGVITRPYGDNFGVFDRMAKRLVKLGMLREYVHGGYEITDAGVRAASEEQTT